jgi:hypothetical protein
LIVLELLIEPSITLVWFTLQLVRKRICLIATIFPSSSIQCSSAWLTLDVVKLGSRSLTFFCGQKYLNKKRACGVLSTLITSEALFKLLPSLNVHDIFSATILKTSIAIISKKKT